MMSRERSLLRTLVQPFAIAAILAVGLRYTALQAYSIPSSSMSPTLEPGDHILATPYGAALFASSPRRGDVIVFRSPLDHNLLLIKRVVGLPGDLVEVRGAVTINGRPLAEPYLRRGDASGSITPLLLAPNTFFVMGDARSDSLDSRSWGNVPREAILARARLIFWSDGRWHGGTTARALSPGDKPGQDAVGIRWSRLFRPVR